MKTFKETLVVLEACQEAIDWVDGKTYEEAYNTCERADWMLWLFTKNWYRPGFPTQKQVLLAACDCAELALEFVPKGEMRPAQAIAAARLAIEDPSEENLEAAEAASCAAAHAAYASLTVSRAASRAADAASLAADTVSDPVDAASCASLAGASHVTMCNLIRARIEGK